MVDIYVDADACPVKDETLRVAARHGLKTYLVSDGGIRPGQNPLVELVIVSQGADAADDWIADRIQDSDICITNDIPLAARCLERGALAIKPNGEPFTEDGIGMALANRELMQGLRESGKITGGPKPFSKSDRSEFLNRLETTVQAAKRQRDRLEPGHP
ncbi:MAG: YaiI/YqxD family protein [Rhodospirillales bacterium]|nr:YaiI/YqxD family protein [Rhodospirillales bacterium]